MFLLTVILSLAVISAGIVEDDVTLSLSDDLTKSLNEVTLTITNANTTTNVTVDISSITAISDKDGHSITITANETTSILVPMSDSKTVTISHSLTPSEKEELAFGDFSTTIEVKNHTDSADKVITTLNFISDFCDNGEKFSTDSANGDEYKLKIADVETDNSDGDDYDWSPLDEITIEVEVENAGDEKVRDIIVELGLFDPNGKNIVKDLEDLNDKKIELGNLDEEDDDTAIFTFTIPADFDDSEGDYYLVIKAYSDDDDDLAGEENICTSHFGREDYYQTINPERETDEENHIVVDNIRLSPTNPQCGEIVQVSVEVFNIGDEDYEDQIKVTLVNKELGIDLEQIISQQMQKKKHII